MKKDRRRDSETGGNRDGKAVKEGRGGETSGKRARKPGGEKAGAAKIYTVKDLARIFQYGAERTIYRLYKKGELPDPLPIGRLLRWDGNKFDEWVRDGCPKPAKRRK